MYSVYFTHTTHKDLLSISCVSPTLPISIYCAFCRFLLHHPRRFIMYFVYFSYFLRYHPQGFILYFCMFLLCHPQGFTLHFVYLSYTTHKDLLGILHISPTPPRRATLLSMGLLSPRTTTLQLTRLVATQAQSYDKPIGSCRGARVGGDKPMVRCRVARLGGDPQRFIVHFVNISYTTHEDLICILYNAPTPPTGIYCVFCALLPYYPQGLFCVFVDFSYTTHGDLLCILCISPAPPTWIYFVFCMFLPRHLQGFALHFV